MSRTHSTTRRKRRPRYARQLACPRLASLLGKDNFHGKEDRCSRDDNRPRRRVVVRRNSEIKLMGARIHLKDVIGVASQHAVDVYGPLGQVIQYYEFHTISPLSGSLR